VNGVRQQVEISRSQLWFSYIPFRGSWLKGDVNEEYWRSSSAVQLSSWELYTVILLPAGCQTQPSNSQLGI